MIKTPTSRLATTRERISPKWTDSPLSSPADRGDDLMGGRNPGQHTRQRFKKNAGHHSDAYDSDRGTHLPRPSPIERQVDVRIDGHEGQGAVSEIVHSRRPEGENQRDGYQGVEGADGQAGHHEREELAQLRELSFT